MCYYSRVIDTDLHLSGGRFSESSMHRIVVQEWSFAFLPCLSSSNTIWSRKEANAVVNFRPEKAILFILNTTHMRCEAILILNFYVCAMLF